MNTLHAYCHRLLFTALALTLIAGCGKKNEPTDVVPEIAEWKKHPDFISFVQRSLNLIAIEDELMVYGENACSVISPNNEAAHYFSSTTGVQYKFPASGILRFLSSDNSSSMVIETWCGSQPSLFFYDFATDTIPSQILLTRYFQGRASSVGFDGKFTFLVPAKSSDLNHPLFYWVTIDTTQYSGGSFRITSGKVTPVVFTDVVVQNMELVNIEYLNGYFWVSFYDRSMPGYEWTYRLHPDHGYLKVADLGFNELFSYNGQMYGTRQTYLYEASPDGMGWVKKQTFSDAVVSQLSYQEVLGEIYFYGNQFIGKLQWNSGNTMELIPFQNPGLEDNYITAIEHFQGKLYVSTYAGLFWLEIDQLK
ncbi:MAG: hypothetical protein R3D00_07150 [Bacteroidia bacterium]